MSTSSSTPFWAEEPNSFAPSHHRHALDEATRAVEVRLKAKLEVDKSGAPLVTDAFNPAPHNPNSPRLRFRDFEPSTQAWINAHQGAMHFGQGVMMRIRNLLEHSDKDISEQEALESLAAISLLARWIDDAVVTRSDERGDSE